MQFEARTKAGKSLCAWAEGVCHLRLLVKAAVYRAQHPELRSQYTPSSSPTASPTKPSVTPTQDSDPAPIQAESAHSLMTQAYTLLDNLRPKAHGAVPSVDASFYNDFPEFLAVRSHRACNNP